MFVKNLTHLTMYVEILDPGDLEFRPIVAGPACETNHLSYLLDILLKPFVENVDSYLRFRNCNGNMPYLETGWSYFNETLTHKTD